MEDHAKDVQDVLEDLQVKSDLEVHLGTHQVDHLEDHLDLDGITILEAAAVVAILTTSKKITETILDQIQMIPTKGAQEHRSQITLLQKIMVKKGRKKKSEDR